MLYFIYIKTLHWQIHIFTQFTVCIGLSLGKLCIPIITTSYRNICNSVKWKHTYRVSNQLWYCIFTGRQSKLNTRQTSQKKKINSVHPFSLYSEYIRDDLALCNNLWRYNETTVKKNNKLWLSASWKRSLKNLKTQLTVLAAVHWNMFHPERNTVERGCGETLWESQNIKPQIFYKIIIIIITQFTVYLFKWLCISLFYSFWQLWFISQNICCWCVTIEPNQYWIFF